MNRDSNLLGSTRVEIARLVVTGKSELIIGVDRDLVSSRGDGDLPNFGLRMSLSCSVENEPLVRY